MSCRLRRVLFSTVLWLVVSTPLFALDFNRYHSQEEINDFLRSSARAHPELVRFHLLGYSDRGREINYVVVTKGDPETLPSLYVNGTHHGNEKSGTESVVALLDYLVKNHAQPDIAALLESYAIYIQPLVNPDGHAAGTRADSGGRDPNRDYGFPERHDDESFKIQAIRLVKELTDKVRFRGAVAFHSGMEAVLWPLCYTSQPSGDYDTFFTLSKLTARAMGVSRYMQSYRDYPTQGEFIDYVYMSHGTLALTLEVSADPAPAASALPRVVQRGVAGGLAFLLGVKELDQGALPIERANDVRRPLAVGPTPRAGQRVE